MHSEKQENGGRIIKSVTHLSVLTNVGLCIVKLAVGLLIGSLAVIADGIHSLSDLATDGAVLLGLHFGSKEPDKSHPYGHGRIETFSAALVAIVLVAVGGWMMYFASISLARDKITCPHFAMAAAGAVSIAAKEWLYRITRSAMAK